MTQFIKVGGIGIIVAVFGIFFFIFSQAVPLFQGASVKSVSSVSLPKNDYRILGVDEWGKLPFLVAADGKLSFVDLQGKRGLVEANLDLPPGVAMTAVSYQPNAQTLAYGTADGRFALAKINYESHPIDGGIAVDGIVQVAPFVTIGQSGVPITAIAFGGDGTNTLIAVLQVVDGKPMVTARTLAQSHSMMGGAGELTSRDTDLSAAMTGVPMLLTAAAQGDRILVADDQGVVSVFARHGAEVVFEQSFVPFVGQANPQLARLDFLLGDVSVVVADHSGAAKIYSLFIPEGGKVRFFGQTKELPALPGAAAFFSASLRNKAFVTGADKTLSLRYGTTGATRWQSVGTQTVKLAALGSKYDKLLTLDDQDVLTLARVDDPHPEAGWRAFWSKVWYEGSNKPKYEWQSTGGSDEFEPKLSLVPLVIGTLKGTLYAILFSVPIALLAALYSSQFLPRGLRAIVKPTMEIMASLPSVVLGFLAALWLAPILEARVPSLMCVTILIPSIAFLFGWVWSVLPMRIRVGIKPGREIFVLLPVVLFAGWLGWHMGPLLERIFFTVTDPTTGVRVADFRLWWPTITGSSFEQRNSLIVGFMMGFAVIPIIYTISDDALSNVPQALKSASLALGASRWQTAVRVVLPTASAGIFSAIMIGVGRAIGETMIVVMATGNTPITSLNIFSGMRTLSANIAVELPEAPAGGTLYRTLFLGAMVLFMLTFVLNTFAEVLRQHLREKYKTV